MYYYYWSLCLIHKFYHRVCMHKQNGIYRVWYYALFQAFTGSLVKHPLWIRGDYCILFNILSSEENYSGLRISLYRLGIFWYS